MIPFFFPFNSQNIKRKALSRSIFLSKSKSRKKRENKKKKHKSNVFRNHLERVPMENETNRRSGAAYFGIGSFCHEQRD